MQKYQHSIPSRWGFATMVLAIHYLSSKTTAYTSLPQRIQPSGTIIQPNSDTQTVLNVVESVSEVRKMRSDTSKNNNRYEHQKFSDVKSDQEWTASLFGVEEAVERKIKKHNISSFQDATGSEVLDVEMDLQLEAARKRSHSQSGPHVTSAFIDSHVSDASISEKFAMEMIPMQLPNPISKVASDQSSTKGVRKRNTTNKDGGQMRVSHEEEIQLARLIQQGAKINQIKAEFEEEYGRAIKKKEWAKLAGLDSPTSLRRLVASYRTAKNKLVTANIGLVHAVVKQNYSQMTKTGVVSVEELVQEGTLGLIRAAELFDPEKGLRFSTYATIWIKGVLSNTKVHQLITIPSRTQTKWNKILKAEKNLGSSGIEASDKKISSMTGISEGEVTELRDRMPKASKMLSLDYQYKSASRSGADESSTTLHGLRSATDDEDLAELLHMKADIVAALARNLEPREARLMRLRYGLKDGKTRTLVECAECMGLSRQRVQQLAKKCLEKIREADDCKSLQEYLLTVA